MALYQSGKALLIVEKDGDDPGRGSLFVSPILLSGVESEGGQHWFYDAVTELAAYCDWLPAQCYRMENGDKCVFQVTFEQSYYRGDGWSSDDDEELVFTKAKKLQHRRGKDISRKALKKFYRPKSKLKYGGKIKFEYKHDSSNDFYFD